MIMPNTEKQWRDALTPEQYKILREKGTEAPFTGKLLQEKRQGVYRCAACGNPLFASDAKFDSGTGWPSFDDALPGAVKFIEDRSHGMTRTEVVCAQCGGHLGHLFDDGPTKTGKRYCTNSVCLEFGPGEQ
jgi:peptide-methionine (R)-S-oxide reductase